MSDIYREIGVLAVDVGLFIILPMYLCYRAAKENKGNRVIALIVGYFFGFIGVLFYYIHYKIIKKKKTKKTEISDADSI